MTHQREPWKVSLHGGHSRLYCDHAKHTLEETLEAAVAAGYHTFGVSEHAPRLGTQFLYPSEIEMGWNVAKIAADFERYAREVHEIADRFEGRITVLRGFETEAVPYAAYREIMQSFRSRFHFDYVVGSVHHVEDIQIDGTPEEFERAVEKFGGLEPLAVRYYEQVAELVSALKPEVVGHLDLIRRNAPRDAVLESPAIIGAARRALEAVRESNAILDLNTAGWRKGLGAPYPAPWLLRRAHEMGIGFCFGDDSHSIEDVGAGIPEARAYLLENGVKTVTVLTREEGTVVKKTLSL